jgi:hypothetical protein
MGQFAQIDVANQDFEYHFIEACKANLREEIDPYTYATITLNELWNGTRYTSADGTDYYYEIRSIDTWHKRPIVIHC